MMTKCLGFLAAVCLVGAAAWSVQAPNPAELASETDEPNGIPEKYRETVRHGLDYLVKNQHNDGHWKGDDGAHPTAMTALAGLAVLLDGGHRFERREAIPPASPYADQARK